MSHPRVSSELNNFSFMRVVSLLYDVCKKGATESVILLSSEHCLTSFFLFVCLFIYTTINTNKSEFVCLDFFVYYSWWHIWPCLIFDWHAGGLSISEQTQPTTN